MKISFCRVTKLFSNELTSFIYFIHSRMYRNSMCFRLIIQKRLQGLALGTIYEHHAQFMYSLLSK